MQEFLKQIKAENFKPSSYTVYNMMYDSGYIEELKSMFDKRYAVEDFEYMTFELSISDKNAIYYYMSCVLNIFRDIKHIIEKDLQDDPNKPKARMYIDKEKSIVMIVKLKEFDLPNRVANMKKNDEPNNSPLIN